MNLIEKISRCNISIVKDINLFDYKELKADQLLVQGYNTSTYKISSDEESLNIINELYSNSKYSNNNTSKISKVKKLNINNYNKTYIKHLEMSKKFLESKFKLHNVFLIKDGIVLSSPFNIKISRIKNKTYDGNIESVFTEIGTENYEILFNTVSLPIIISKIFPEIYCHEITHTQLMSIFGSVDNFLNREVLPIFMELLYQYENNYQSTYRLKHLQISSSYINKDCDFNIATFTDMLYYTSIVTAYKLFNIYLKGNNFVKEEMIKNIQAVFDNKFTLESLLDKYDLDWTKKRVIH